MKLALMQPYFFPYLGYFSLIEHVDKFIYFDTPQYIRRGWVNRNRILHPQEGARYITVPIKKASRETPINEIRIDYSQDWTDRILRQLKSYQKTAPNYAKVMELVETCLNKKFVLLSELNTDSTDAVCRYLDIRTETCTLSDMHLQIGKVEEPQDWALNISIELGYETYINPPGGQSIYDKGKYQKAGIDLYFIDQKLEPYKQSGNDFVAGLSIIDVMMFNTPEQIKNMMTQYQYI